MAEVTEILKKNQDKLKLYNQTGTFGLNSVIKPEEEQQDIDTIVKYGQTSGKAQEQIDQDIARYKGWNDPTDDTPVKEIFTPQGANIPLKTGSFDATQNQTVQQPMSTVTQYQGAGPAKAITPVTTADIRNAAADKLRQAGKSIAEFDPGVQAKAAAIGLVDIVSNLGSYATSERAAEGNPLIPALFDPLEIVNKLTGGRSSKKYAQIMSPINRKFQELKDNKELQVWKDEVQKVTGKGFIQTWKESDGFFDGLKDVGKLFTVDASQSFPQMAVTGIAGPAVGFAVNAVNSTEQQYQQLKALGIKDNIAKKVSTFNGLIQGGLEQLGDMINLGELKTDGKGIIKTIFNVASETLAKTKFGQAVVDRIIPMLSEGVTEGLQTFDENLGTRIAIELQELETPGYKDKLLATGYKLPALNDNVLDAALRGIGSAGVFQAGGDVLNIGTTAVNKLKQEPTFGITDTPGQMDLFNQPQQPEKIKSKKEIKKEKIIEEAKTNPVIEKLLSENSKIEDIKERERAARQSIAENKADEMAAAYDLTTEVGRAKAEAESGINAIGENKGIKTRKEKTKSAWQQAQEELNYARAAVLNRQIPLRTLDIKKRDVYAKNEMAQKSKLEQWIKKNPVYKAFFRTEAKGFSPLDSSEIMFEKAIGVENIVMDNYEYEFIPFLDSLKITIDEEAPTLQKIVQKLKNFIPSEDTISQGVNTKKEIDIKDDVNRVMIAQQVIEMYEKGEKDYVLPGGKTVEQSIQNAYNTIETTKTALGEKGYKTVEKKISEFRKLMYKNVIEPLIGTWYTKEEAQRIKNSNDFYAPMRRMEKEGNLITAREQGSELNIENAFMQYGDMIRASALLRTRNEFLNTFDFFREADTDSGIKLVQTYDITEDPATWKAPEIKPEQIVYKKVIDDSHSEWVVLEVPKVLKKTIDSMTAGEQSIWAKWLSMPARMKRELATSMSIAFNLANVPADLVTLTLTYPGFIFTPWEFAKAFGQRIYAPDMFRWISKNGGGTNWVQEDVGKVKNIKVAEAINKRSLSQIVDETVKGFKEDADNVTSKINSAIREIKDTGLRDFLSGENFFETKDNIDKKMTEIFNNMSQQSIDQALSVLSKINDFLHIPASELEATTRRAAAMKYKKDLMKNGKLTEAEVEALAVKFYNDSTVNFGIKGFSKAMSTYSNMRSFLRASFNGFGQAIKVLAKGGLYTHYPKHWTTQSKVGGFMKNTAIMGIMTMASIMLTARNRRNDEWAEADDMVPKRYKFLGGYRILEDPKNPGHPWYETINGKKYPKIQRFPLKHTGLTMWIFAAETGRQIMKKGIPWLASKITNKEIKKQISDINIESMKTMGIAAAAADAMLNLNPLGSNLQQAAYSFIPDFLAPAFESFIAKKNLFFNYNLDYNPNMPVKDRVGRYQTLASEYIRENLKKLFKLEQPPLSAAEIQHLIVGYFPDMGRLGLDIASTKPVLRAVLDNALRGYFPDIKWSDKELEYFGAASQYRNIISTYTKELRNEKLDPIRKKELYQEMVIQATSAKDSLLRAQINKITESILSEGTNAEVKTPETQYEKMLRDLSGNYEYYEKLNEKHNGDILKMVKEWEASKK
jgi:hypothetical protein